MNHKDRSPTTGLFGIAERLLDLLEREGNEACIAVGRLIAQRLRAPQSYVTVVGETRTSPLEAL